MQPDGVQECYCGQSCVWGWYTIALNWQVVWL